MTSECPLVLSFPGHLSEKFLSLKNASSAVSYVEGVNRKNNLADHYSPDESCEVPDLPSLTKEDIDDS